ncbi:putative WRKY transcription factor 19 [Morella rubra]|uniref:Putative WRKY transcription factor 19 n=1 Tax=Morella rubra TaxID=262757 RepID=A0A6A1WTK9_9ROSI|nr:putative WRKY transcription factor 19 [Morella rubra]
MDFNPDNLIELKMRGSSIKQMWKEINFCKNLRELPDKISLESLEDFILSGCSRLEKFPDIVGNMTSLGLLYLDGTSIREVPPPFGNLFRLAILSFRDCEKLLKLPINMCRLSNLRFLQLSGCRRLEKFPDLRSMECLEELYAVGTAITQLSPIPIPSSIKIIRLTGFESSFGRVLVYQKLSNYNPLARTSFWKELRCFSKNGCGLTFYSPNEYDVLHVEVRSGSCEHREDYLKLMRSAYDWIGTAYDKDVSDLSNNLVMFTWEFFLPPKRLHLFAPKQVWNTPRPAYSTKRGIWTYIPVQWFVKELNIDPFGFERASSPRSDMIRRAFRPKCTPANADGVVDIKKWGTRVVYEHNASEFFSSIAPPGLESEFHSRLFYYFNKGNLDVLLPISRNECSDQVQRIRSDILARFSLF